MNKQKLKEFLIKSNRVGYAGGQEKQWVKQPDGSTTIEFVKDEWRSHDNFFGGEPYGGRLVVFYKDKPVWIMVYYGWVKPGIEPKSVYPTLQNALKKMPKNAPFRGPAKYQEKDFIYTNQWIGDVDRYSGKEQIKKGDKLAYKASYIGGLVDQ